jgi:peptidoglycan/LPS O-acetylase OafA/YrhL
MFGVLIGYLYHFRRPVFERIGRYRVSIFAASLVLLTTTSPWIPVSAYASTLGFSATYIAFGGILVATLSTEWSRFPTGVARAAHPAILGLRFLGVYSYTIYLTHVPLYYSLPLNDVIDRWPVGEAVRPQLAAALFLALAIVSGVLLSHFIERPVLRWRERHFSGRGTAVSARGSHFEPATGCPA